LICQALVEQSFTFETLADIETTVSLCQSPDDDLITPYPSIAGYPNLEIYEAPFSILQPQGNHFQGAVACAIQPILFYRRTNLRTVLPNPPESCPYSSPQQQQVLPECPVLEKSPAPAPAPATTLGSDESEYSGVDPSATGGIGSSSSSLLLLSMVMAVVWT
jgi:hypothetical protein